MRKETKEAFDNIIMTAAGGHIDKFVSLQMGIEAFGKQAEAGDEGAQRLVTIMINFSKLIDALHRTIEENRKNDNPPD